MIKRFKGDPGTVPLQVFMLNFNLKLLNHIEMKKDPLFFFFLFEAPLAIFWGMKHTRRLFLLFLKDKNDDRLDSAVNG